MATTHGRSKTRLYRIWATVKTRCNNPNDVGYSHYGGNGISMCPEWEESFVAFEEWAIEAGYRESENCELEIHRTDSHGDYNPDNCEWVEPEEHGMIHGGEFDTVTEIRRNTSYFHNDPFCFEQSAFDRNPRRPFLKPKTKVGR